MDPLGGFPRVRGGCGLVLGLYRASGDLERSGSDLDACSVCGSTPEEALAEVKKAKKALIAAAQGARASRPGASLPTCHLRLSTCDGPAESCRRASPTLKSELPQAHLGLAIYSSSEVLYAHSEGVARSWGPDALADQRLGGAIVERGPPSKSAYNVDQEGSRAPGRRNRRSESPT